MKHELSNDEVATLNFWYGFLLAESEKQEDKIFSNAFNSFENFVMRITKEQQEGKKN